MRARLSGATERWKPYNQANLFSTKIDFAQVLTSSEQLSELRVDSISLVVDKESLLPRRGHFLLHGSSATPLGLVRTCELDRTWFGLGTCPYGVAATVCPSFFAALFDPL